MPDLCVGFETRAASFSLDESAEHGYNMGQQKVNNAAPEHPRTCELIWLNSAFRPASPSYHESLASTLNPKVEGSNPSRPTLKTPANVEIRSHRNSRKRHAGNIRLLTRASAREKTRSSASGSEPSQHITNP